MDRTKNYNLGHLADLLLLLEIPWKMFMIWIKGTVRDSRKCFWTLSQYWKKNATQTWIKWIETNKQNWSNWYKLIRSTDTISWFDTFFAGHLKKNRILASMVHGTSENLRLLGSVKISKYSNLYSARVVFLATKPSIFFVCDDDWWLMIDDVRDTKQIKVPSMVDLPARDMEGDK